MNAKAQAESQRHSRAAQPNKCNNDLSFQRTGYSVHAKMAQNTHKCMKASRWLGGRSRVVSAVAQYKEESVVGD